MKTMRMMIVGLFVFALLAGQQARAYYNPCTGRWLSRDPIGEHAFVSPLIREAIESDQPEKAENLSRESNKPLYLFALNSPIAVVDALGLKIDPSEPVSMKVPDCNIRVFAGHGLGDGWFDENGDWIDSSTANKTRAYSSLEVPAVISGNLTCSAGTIIACNAKWFSKIANPLPGIELADRSITKRQGLDQIDAAVRAAQAHAKSICKSCCACKEVSIAITCHDEFVTGPFTTGSPWCGKVLKVPCK